MDIARTAVQINEISARYASIYGFERDTDWLLLKAQEELGELTQAWLAKSGRQRDKGRTPREIEEGFAHELADTIGVLMALAVHTGVDIERAIDEKWLVWDRRAVQRADELGEVDTPRSDDR